MKRLIYWCEIIDRRGEEINIYSTTRCLVDRKSKMVFRDFYGNVVEPLVDAIKMLLSHCSPRLISGFSIDTIRSGRRDLESVSIEIRMYRWLFDWKIDVTLLNFTSALIDRISNILCGRTVFFFSCQLSISKIIRIILFPFSFSKKYSSLYSLYFDRTSNRSLSLEKAS